MSSLTPSGVTFALVSVLLFLPAGCAPSPVIIPSAGPRPPTEPGAVQILTKPPAKYQILGVVETTQNLRWGPDAQIDPAMDTLKTKAAALGATGLLLEAKGSTNKAVGMYRSRTYEVPIARSPAMKAMATAVYIIDP